MTNRSKFTLESLPTAEDKELISKEQIAYEEEMEAIRKSEYAKGEWI